MARRCVFCGSTSNKNSKEHAFPRWLEKYVPRPAGRRYVAEHHGSHSELPDRPSTIEREMKGLPSYGIVVRGVCEPCNNGWMEDLERRVAPILAPMLKAREVPPLQRDERELLATWAWKTFAMLCLASDERTNPLAADAFTYLYVNRRPPPRSVVWLARTTANEPDAAYFIHSCTLSRPGDPVPFRANTYLASVWVGPVAFLLYGTSAGLVPVIDLDTQFAGSVAARAHGMLYPADPRRGPFKWPPGDVLDDEAYANALTEVFRAMPHATGRGYLEP